MPYQSARGAVQGHVRGIARHILELQMCWTAVCVEIGGSEKAPAQDPRAYRENTNKLFGSGAGGTRDPAL